MSEATKVQNTYGGILKALTLFGGVKVIQILISIVRSKLIAILIGPTGMGINDLLRSTTDMVNNLTGCGLQTSAVRDVAKAYNDNDFNKINTTITTLRYLTLLTGMIGALVVLIFAESFSAFAFGNSDYTNAFRILSIMMLFTQIVVGQTALMQGCFRYKDMAKATLVGQILSFLITIPLYYFWGNDGIVPALLLSSFVGVIISTIFARRVPYEKVKLSLKAIWENGRGMLTLGGVIALGSVVGNISSYLMNIIISNVDSIKAVGLYSAAMTISNSYVFLVLSAMSTDYVPRLSAVSGDNKEQINAINKQMEMVILILTPLIMLFIVFAKEAIDILYTSEFYIVIHMLELLMFGMFFRAVSWCISYAFIARGDSSFFLLLESTMAVISILLKFIGFYLGSFNGIGMAIIIEYLLYTIIMTIAAKYRFGFSYSKEFVKLAMTCILLTCIVLLISLSGGIAWWKYTTGVVIVIFTVFHLYKELNKRVSWKEFL